ncbi:MAG: aminotransferase class I/II-fold pyridoxal phosphate-dependent enzyme [Pikeienuella sp.]
MPPSTDQMLSQLRQLRSKRQPGKSASASASGENTTRVAYDFTKLKDYEQMRIQAAAAEFAGMSSPFFRRHDAVDGVSSRIDGRERINFATYDYLGLNAHPVLREAAQNAVAEWGVSATASRLVGGERPYHTALEDALAKTHGVEAALAMVSGHATNVTTLGALLGPRDLVLTDTLIHNSITEGCKLAGAKRVAFPHNDTDWIDDYLARNRHMFEHVMIVVEGLYSMDGDVADLKALVRLKNRHDAWLMVDEAHSLGVLGETGRGLAEHAGVNPNEVELWMGTMSKTLGSCGGYIAGSRALIDFLKFKASGFVFSVGLSAPAAAAALAALQIMEQETDRTARLKRNGAYFKAKAESAGLDTGLSLGYAVAPILIGSSLEAGKAADRLFSMDVNALPIIFPAVPEKSARIRFFVTSEHTEAHIDQAVDATAAALSA